ncbi:hypothetical protein N7491_009000 [Penicillium cf. griseofulvum]|uniref:Xylanolytic transcriptional activator regulatory domain-containing protein n=1 Tax=Penicillium cf. griseofulvum TaxID=2972120 RepID=A0A9W9MF38_9EURO|nr:hypothetical protein N7472_005404 [Penicillium cf. griseofulvum]KAJ5423784.1 hypothetical protein N7491_009000 [Penicillium cf. griseofulvum]KAJ5430963.1 hypothetical protein N7445_008695 [Penicillium cf. griseofulvum]
MADTNHKACTTCQARDKKCAYGQLASALGKQTARKPRGRASPAQKPASMLVSPPASVTTTPPMVDSVHGSHHLDEDREAESDLEQDRAYCTAHGRFADQVAAAIDLRAGLIPTTCQVPLVDAPLFGDLNLPSQSCLLSSSTELPPREYADQLIDIYWRHVHPAEPVLDRQRFLEKYDKAYSAPITPLCADYDLWLGILNLVFALAVQRQEQNPLHQRNEEGNCFFQRAWALLPAESLLWKPGSLELVQCLMLMNRYLHCTNNQQKTWMTAGLAMRIAQSMCCHLAEAPLVKGPSSDKALKRKIWASCVALDRCISWSLGKTSALVLIPSPPANSFQQLSQNPMHNNWGLGLHEIGNQIQLAQIQTRTSLAARFRPPLVSQQDEYHSAALQLDACLQSWENSLPSDWQSQNLKMIVDRSSRAERYLLHLRYLHHRIFLYRPMLARFYSMKPGIHSLKSPSLSHRLLRESASMCIEAAQQVASLVNETLEPEEPIGLLPWWYRIYYLHIAGANFLAAMFRSELFTDSVSQSWKEVLLALRAHEHLSPYVQQCVWTFETLAARITGKFPSLDGSGCGLMADGFAGACFDDLFKDVNFDFDSFIFGPEEFGEGLV